MAADTQRARAGSWRKSSFSGMGDCVEVRRGHDGSACVRDSKDPDGPNLRFTASEWQAFVEGVRAGEFADPDAG